LCKAPRQGACRGSIAASRKKPSLDKITGALLIGVVLVVCFFALVTLAIRQRDAAGLQGSVSRSVMSPGCAGPHHRPGHAGDAREARLGWLSAGKGGQDPVTALRWSMWRRAGQPVASICWALYQQGNMCRPNPQRAFAWSRGGQGNLKAMPIWHRPMRKVGTMKDDAKAVEWFTARRARYVDTLSSACV